MLLVRLHIHINLLKPKAYKLFENSDADFSWCLFLKKPTCSHVTFNIHIYYIPSGEILEFPSVINFDIITSDDINFHFLFLPKFGNYFFSLSTYR